MQQISKIEYYIEDIYYNLYYAMEAVEVHYVHDNGGRPYKVVISGLTVKVHCLIPTDDYNADAQYFEEPSLTISAARVFVGPSPLCSMTSFSGGHGPRFYGNTILAQLQPEHGKNTYVWIGNRGVVKFTTKFPVVNFMSPVGNSDVPYPWVEDSVGNYYLLLDNVILVSRDGLSAKISEDPYRYYYDNSRITEVSHRRDGKKKQRVPTSILLGFANITGYFIGQENYNLSYHTDAGKHYDWVQTWDEESAGHEPGEMTVEKTSGMIVPLSREDYVNLMDAAGKFAGFEPMHDEIICKRDKTKFTVSNL